MHTWCVVHWAQLSSLIISLLCCVLSPHSALHTINGYSSNCLLWQHAANNLICQTGLRPLPDSKLAQYIGSPQNTFLKCRWQVCEILLVWVKYILAFVKFFFLLNLQKINSVYSSNSLNEKYNLWKSLKSTRKSIKNYKIKT